MNYSAFSIPVFCVTETVNNGVIVQPVKLFSLAFNSILRYSANQLGKFQHISVLQKTWLQGLGKYLYTKGYTVRLKDEKIILLSFYFSKLWSQIRLLTYKTWSIVCCFAVPKFMQVGVHKQNVI